MRISILLSSIVCLLLVLSAFEPDAYGKSRKKRRNKQKVEAVEETDVQEEAVEEEPAESEDAAEGEEPEKKSISEQLSGDSDGGEGGMRRSNRMEFDERLVKGQAAKSGAVYLFKRVPRHLPGLVPMRRSYRRRIVQPVLGMMELKPARYSFEVEKELKLKRQKLDLETGAPKPVVVETAPESAPEEVKESEPAPEEKPTERSKKKKKRKK